jgi:hypothetical protein
MNFRKYLELAFDIELEDEILDDIRNILGDLNDDLIPGVNMSDLVRNIERHVIALREMNESEGTTLSLSYKPYTFIGDKNEE